VRRCEEAVAAKVFGGLTCVRRLVVRRGGNRFELDNLVDLVLTAVGARPSDHTSLWATVDAGGEPGVEIAEQRPLSPPGSAVAVKLESAPQRSVRTTERLAELVEHAPLVGDEPCGCFLTLGRDTAGVVFGFEGPIKPTIDALWPHLGGAAHSPADHRIRDLRVSRDESQTGGLGRTVVDGGPVTPAEAAALLDTDARRIRAWLRRQRGRAPAAGWTIDTATFNGLREAFAVEQHGRTTASSRTPRVRDEI
jgi:hypothetical protein